ncbi:hypothetical protein EPUS_01906 [Endocarpon pusillum Z07020]|uniref:Protein scd2/ral3 n=1 Tax=Endocarpon pusillum (strain Z07020 / HMAS-L-300199) TaxID=1263415 RepID=U1GD02_ENDPU|nr:uncharacterized protein EPUS_01906 [Endocarpon pusillum Z07020]ERF69576.1 hypothetical protein EPUS_01906 [Endocarpon pusillum Z07020]
MKVIKALYDYEPQSTETQELSFHKGDFFHVISREDDPDWYEACNPLIPTARGLVPVAFFEVIGKTERQSGGSIQSVGAKQESHDSGFSDRGAGQNRPDSTTNTTRSAANARSSTSVGKSSGAMVYGIVLYDFDAERPDELEAKAGEYIIVIAQSNPEWFVAKPIRRLGGPGLIPVSFIEIQDIATGKPVADPNEAIQRAGVPKVEEWKKMAADYKNSSISLGKFDAQQQMTSDMGRMSLGSAGTPYHNQPSNGYGSHQKSSSRSGPPGQYFRQSQQQNLLAPVSASLPRYCFDNDMYWYIIECQMEDGRHWELSRYYADFYDFQIALLKEFPEEAGNRGSPRTLPFMPGPVAHVTDAISNGRRQNLDEYIRKILSMPPHISRCQLVRALFAPRPNDFEIDPNAVGEDYRLSGASQHSTLNDPSQSASRQSSNGAMNGSAYGGMPPPSTRPAHQRGQPSLSGSPAASANPGFLQPMNRQPSSLTQASVTSSAAPTSGGAMKVKVMFQEELIVIRVPSDITYLQLKDKLRDRLKVSEELVIQYKDEPSNSRVNLNNDTDLDVALQRNTKLTLFVNYAS